MEKLQEQSQLHTPICLVEGDMKALLLMDKMNQENIPVFFNTKNLVLYTNSEENAEKARYLLFSGQ